ncbi:hypothetical protein Pan153_62670 [Gimesia panareensis]|uniref:Uncharacterized protein n=1 Tax=Gimesia panareensis TaxID=2527978 RepID=A0A518FYY0_9PLAN|nr:hypothetical protein Pan153_62670 [Gimesia panareensis]
MHRFYCVLTTCLCLVLISTGCRVSVGVNAESETDMGSHHVIVRPGNAMTSSTSVTFGDSATYEFTCGAVKIKIENEALSVNGKSYGMLEPEQEIEVDNGTVTVAGQVRQPVAVGQEIEAEKPSQPKPEAD